MPNYNSLPNEKKESIEKSRPTGKVLTELEKKAKALESDPTYYAEYLKAEFADEVYNAMEKEGLNKKALAEKLGFSRQYVGRVLNENANFTIETMAAFSRALNKKLRINMVSKNEELENTELDYEINFETVYLTVTNFVKDEYTEEYSETLLHKDEIKKMGHLAG